MNNHNDEKRSDKSIIEKSLDSINAYVNTFNNDKSTKKFPSEVKQIAILLRATGRFKNYEIIGAIKAQFGINVNQSTLIAWFDGYGMDNLDRMNVVEMLNSRLDQKKLQIMTKALNMAEEEERMDKITGVSRQTNLNQSRYP